MRAKIITLLTSLLFCSTAYSQVEPGKVYSIEDIKALHEAGEKELVAEILPPFRFRQPQGAVQRYRNHLWKCVNKERPGMCTAVAALDISPKELEAAMTVLNKTGYVAVPKYNIKAMSEEMSYMLEHAEALGERMVGTQKHLNDIMVSNSKESIELLQALMNKGGED
ncbi:hypothetical protein [Ferrimonas sp.]|uniref:hypothetical protein n=1 Tax=Ferrimonas sp. TaxID=2080861 RepID=UPI003A91EC8C